MSEEASQRDKRRAEDRVLAGMLPSAAMSMDTFGFDYDRAAFVTGPAGKPAWYGALFRIMPLWANRLLGSMVYRFAA